MASRFIVGTNEDIESCLDDGNSRTKNASEKATNGEGKAEDVVKLNIIVVGGGIAGLSAAIMLSRAGHDVTVLERSKFKKEAGFMITLGSNAVRVLNSFDFDFRRARAVDCDFVETFNGHTLELFTSHPMRHAGMDDTLRPKTFYRPDLHNELKRIALLRSPNFKPPTLKLGVEVLGADIKAGIVTLIDGSKMTGDLLVGADGERSVVKNEFKDGESLRQASYKIFRAIVPTEKLSSNKRDRAMMALTNKKFAIFMGMNKQVSWFEGRDGLMQDLEAGYLLSKGEERKAERNPQKAYEKMMEKFQDFHPDIVNALAKADRVSDWEVHYSRPLPHLYKEKALLVGDAAHSMYPTTGQGGSQSLEDVGCLGVLLSALDSHAELDSRLKLYEKVRKDRASMVQALSGIVYGTEKEFAKSRPWHAINQTEIRSPEAHVNFIFSYDILEESRRALKESVKVRASL